MSLRVQFLMSVVLALLLSLAVEGAVASWQAHRSVENEMRRAVHHSGAALLLIWAGLVEAFFSQYHEPTLPYPFKIVFGLFKEKSDFSFLFTFSHIFITYFIYI